jgi:hypothetical protein
MTHPAACEAARLHKCECSYCGGTLHGWPYRLTLAREHSDTFHYAAERSWEAANQKKNGKKPTKKKLEAISDIAVSNIIDALSEIITQGSTTPTADILAQKIGGIVSSKAIDVVNGSLGLRERRRRQKLQADHFWCDILASMACALDKVGALTDKVPEYAAARVLDPKRADRPPAAEEVVVQLAAKTIWNEICSQITAKLLVNLPVIRQVQDLSRAIRILAILMCPAPENHRIVIQCCVKPMEESILSPAIKEQLIRLLHQAGRS